LWKKICHYRHPVDTEDLRVDSLFWASSRNSWFHKDWPRYHGLSMKIHNPDAKELSKTRYSCGQCCGLGCTEESICTIWKTWDHTIKETFNHIMEEHVSFVPIRYICDQSRSHFWERVGDGVKEERKFVDVRKAMYRALQANGCVDGHDHILLHHLELEDDETERVSYLCLFCGKEFTGELELKRHMSDRYLDVAHDIIFDANNNDIIFDANNNEI